MLDPALEPLAGHLDRAALFVDFDGTLSDIIDDPASARPRPGAVEALVGLASRGALVGVVSGRPVAFLEPFFPEPEIALVGIYGLEQRIDGRRTDHPEAGVWREVVADVLAAAAAHGPVGMRTEGKGLSLTVHYREAPDQADAVAEWAARQSARTGLELRRARRSFELHPPLATDKGTALEALVDRADHPIDLVVYIGDDVGDLPAFAGLDRLAAAGRRSIRVAATSPEAAPELLAEADLVVGGPPAVVALLEALASA